MQGYDLQDSRDIADDAGDVDGDNNNPVTAHPKRERKLLAYLDDYVLS